MDQHKVTKCENCGARNWAADGETINKYRVVIAYHCKSCQHEWKAEYLLRG